MAVGVLRNRALPELSHRTQLILGLLLLAISITSAGAAETPPAFTATLPLGLPVPGPRANASQVALGAYLFQSKALSRDGTVACASCHVAWAGMSDPDRLSRGVGGYLTNRHALPLQNLYIYKSYMADGRAASLPAQHLLPLESPEMAIDWQQSLARLASNPEARELGARAGFGALAKPEVVAAIAAYVGSLVSGGSRFDRFYYGHDEAALTDQEQRGLRIFVRKGRCSTCHLLDGNAAPLTDGSFHSVGVGFAHGRYTDHGRIAVTGRPSDDGVFKTPSLRNVSRRPFLMHDGSMGSLQQVVAYYNRGGTPTAVNQDPRIRPLFLSDDEVGDLVEFLRALEAPVISVAAKEM